ncbi:hypothetical protein GCM10022210_49210 [Mucilaginibacter dorajii]|uniref:Adhesin domain-containing protein n=2 Tax=Mucilaginibacter dorajii TaxID=692994 RepID=A0ABP7R0H6_9SPHI
MSVKNFDGELEIRGSASNFEINNITGPLVLNLTDMTTDPGKVSISHINWQKIYAQKKKLPFYILSNYHDVNFSFPENIKVNVNVTCVRGKLFSNLNIINSQTDSNTKDSFSGRLNGGGIPIYIHNENGNVYLRKEN